MKLISSIADRLLRDVRVLQIPVEIVWGDGQIWLVDVFDWDTVLLARHFSVKLDFALNLCIGIFPCRVHLIGNLAGAIHRLGTGYISCDANNGCLEIECESVRVLCDTGLALISVFDLRSSSLIIKNSSFQDCFSPLDGGVIHAHDNAKAVVEYSSFWHCSSVGFGGAIGLYDSTAQISQSTFFNCSSQRGGGAIWAVSFQRCYGSTEIEMTEVIIILSTFKFCHSKGDGGAILFASDSKFVIGQSLIAQIASTEFLMCRADLEGGALGITGNNVSINISRCNFSSCHAELSGGSISANQDAAINVFSSQFERNSALTMGGAVSLDTSAKGTFYGNLFESNNAGIYGGAISASSNSILLINSSQFLYNSAKDSGGAICASNDADISIFSSTLKSNSAHGLGGGGIYFDHANSLIYNLSCLDNSAPFGGGGFLLWRGELYPTKQFSSSCPPETTSKIEECFLTSQIYNCSFTTCSSVTMNNTALSHCRRGNTAIYGQFIASDFKRFEHSKSIGSVYAGLPFAVALVKKDAYNQTIASDSSSVLQASLTLDGITKSSDDSTLNGTFSILGNNLGRLQKGVALFQFAIKPTISNVDVQNGISHIYRRVSIELEGSDSQTGRIVRTDLINVNFGEGADSCPLGYILELDQQGASNSSAQCSRCRPATYSINPLAHSYGSSSKLPECITCPAGLNCEQGGSEIRFNVGIWTPVDGVYILTSCPAGYQLINSSDGSSRGQFSNAFQMCRKCREGEYIIDPNTNECQNCPPGVSSKCIYILHV